MVTVDVRGGEVQVVGGKERGGGRREGGVGREVQA